MTTTAANPTNDTPRASAGRVVAFLPPEKLARYQWAKAIGAAFFIVIFAGWLFIQWSNPVMRGVAIVLLLLTAWFTLRSIVGDAMRSHGRRIELTWSADADRNDAHLRITTPQSVMTVPVRDIHCAKWSEDDDSAFGLWLMDRHGQTLAHLDAWFVDHEEEARTFLNWARQHTRFDFPIQWPQKA